MGDSENNYNDIFAKRVRAGKRTYFFDVRETRKGEYYLTITESKRRFNADNGKFFYEKHKVFVYKEDFEKFTEGLTEVIDYIKKNQEVIEFRHEDEQGNSSEEE